MGQKINTTGFRVGKRLSWSSLWCDASSNYASAFCNDLELRHHNKVLFDSMGLFTNNIVIRKNAKRLQSFSKLATSEAIIGKWFSYGQRVKEQPDMKRKRLLRKQAHGIGSLFSLSDKYALEYQKYKNIGEYDMKIGTSNKQTMIPFITGQVLSDYISEQLKTSLKLRDKSFRTSLQRGIAKIATRLLSGSKMQLISGMKIMCSGK